MGKRMLEWDDLQFVLAINRTQSLTGAAVTLGVSYPTVFRRLNQLEQRLEARLFERASGHYRPTSAGERIILASERIEAEVVAVEREVAGRDAGPSGRLKIIAPEALAYRVLNKLFAEFQKQHKGIELELVTDSRLLDLSRREADVAIRAMRPKEDDMFGRKVADVAWAVYGSEAYFSSRRIPKDITDLGGRDFDVLLVESAESRSRDPDVVPARHHVHERIAPVVIGNAIAREPGLRAGESHFGGRHNRAGLILYGANDRAVQNLRRRGLHSEGDG